MGRIDDAILTLDETPDPTERALQLAGLISTLFKIKGVALVVTRQLAFDAYANTVSAKPELELAAFAGELTPRDILEVMRGQLRAVGSLYRWSVSGIPVRFENPMTIALPQLCCDITTAMGVVKLVPVEEITADYILAAHFPGPDSESHSRAHLLLVSGLADVFHMDWAALQALCYRPSHRIGEELARMRLAAKKDVDAMGMAKDHIGETAPLPQITPKAASQSPATPPISATEEIAAHTAALGPDIVQSLPGN